MPKAIFIPTIFITNWHMRTFTLIVIFLAYPLFTLCFALRETSHSPWQYSVLVPGSGEILSIFLGQSLRPYSSFANNTYASGMVVPTALFFQGYFTIKPCNLKFFLWAATWFCYPFIYHLNILHFSFWPYKELVALDRRSFGTTSLYIWSTSQKCHPSYKFMLSITSSYE